MSTHELLALQVRDAIALGELPKARRYARELASARIRKLTPELEERAALSQDAAGRVARAESLDAAAREFGALTKTCGACHARHTGPTWIEATNPPPNRIGVHAEMMRHAWAMDQMWLGAIGNSEAPWRAGAETFANPGSITGELAKRGGDKLGTYASVLSTAGSRALATSDADMRSEVLGEILSACAGCHEKLRPPQRTEH